MAGEPLLLSAQRQFMSGVRGLGAGPFDSTRHNSIVFT
ncbi:hypothetical protein GGD67_003025 [Bradyrhizobium sp. IAR9]|nr:hypothetical protein [Bradyrhizobium sp. IAR9]